MAPNTSSASHPDACSFNGFLDFPDEILVKIYQMSLEKDDHTLGDESIITSFRKLNKYLAKVFDMRTAAIANEAFGTSRFFDDVALGIHICGHEEYRNLPDLDLSSFQKFRWGWGRVLYARATDMNLNHGPYINIYGLDSSSRTYDIDVFAQSVFARRMKMVVVRMNVAQAARATIPGQINTPQWITRLVWELLEVIRVMPRLERIQISHNMFWQYAQRFHAINGVAIKAGILLVLQTYGVTLEQHMHSMGVGWTDLSITRHPLDFSP